MPLYVATLSGAGVHSIKDMESGEIICAFMLRKGGDMEGMKAHLSICLRALNYVNEQREANAHEVASDSLR